MEEGDGDGRFGYLSDVHLGCPPVTQGGGGGTATATVATRFAFFPAFAEEEEEEHAASSSPGSEKDSDGDLAVRRKRRRTDGQQCITIRHSMETTLPDVGLQVREGTRDVPVRGVRKRWRRGLPSG